MLFAWNRNYFILLFVGVFLSSFGSTANRRCSPLPASMPTAPGGSGDVQLDTARAGVACVGDWPPLAYALAMGFGFTVMYLSAAVAFVVCGAMVWFFLPSMRKEAEKWRPVRWKHRGVTGATHYCYSLSVRLMWGTNSLYIINMPLFIIDELHLPEKLAGIMMGTAAGLEIPTMLIAGYYAASSARFLMRIAAVAGLLFYVGMLTVHTPALLLALRKLLNAIYIGILAGIGMLYFQDLMPGQAGAATTLYTNTTRVGYRCCGLTGRRCG